MFGSALHTGTLFQIPFHAFVTTVVLFTQVPPSWEHRPPGRERFQPHFPKSTAFSQQTPKQKPDRTPDEDERDYVCVTVDWRRLCVNANACVRVCVFSSERSANTTDCRGFCFTFYNLSSVFSNRKSLVLRLYRANTKCKSAVWYSSLHNS